MNWVALVIAILFAGGLCAVCIWILIKSIKDSAKKKKIEQENMLKRQKKLEEIENLKSPFFSKHNISTASDLTIEKLIRFETAQKLGKYLKENNRELDAEKDKSLAEHFANETFVEYQKHLIYVNIENALIEHQRERTIQQNKEIKEFNAEIKKLTQVVRRNRNNISYWKKQELLSAVSRWRREYDLLPLKNLRDDEDYKILCYDKLKGSIKPLAFDTLDVTNNSDKYVDFSDMRWY